MALRVVPMVSDLQLQKLLYFSVWSGLWFGATEIGLTVFKLTQLDVTREPFTKIGLPVLVSVWCLLEMFRIRLGYSGNLGEKVPETSAFWLLTLLPQLPIAAFLAFAQPMHLPMDLGAGVVHVALCAGQLYYGFRAVRGFIRKQTADFYRLCQNEALSASHANRKRAVRTSGEGTYVSPRSAEASQPWAAGTLPRAASAAAGLTSAGSFTFGSSSGAGTPRGSVTFAPYTAGGSGSGTALLPPLSVGGAGAATGLPPASRRGLSAASASEAAAAQAAAAAAAGQAYTEPQVTAMGVAVDGVRHLTGTLTGSRVRFPDTAAEAEKAVSSAGAGGRDRDRGSSRDRRRDAEAEEGDGGLSPARRRQPREERGRDREEEGRGAGGGGAGSRPPRPDRGSSRSRAADEGKE